VRLRWYPQAFCTPDALGLRAVQLVMARPEEDGVGSVIAPAWMAPGEVAKHGAQRRAGIGVLRPVTLVKRCWPAIRHARR
jgi:hypothetical protein